MKNLMWKRLFWLCIKLNVWAIICFLIGGVKLAAFMIVAAFFVFIASAISMFVWAFKP